MCLTLLLLCVPSVPVQLFSDSLLAVISSENKKELYGMGYYAIFDHFIGILQQNIFKIYYSMMFCINYKIKKELPFLQRISVPFVSV